MIRRARGYVPRAIPLQRRWDKDILAVGAELKSTVTYLKGDQAFVSQHIGDMQNMDTFAHYEQTLTLYRDLFDIAPEIVAYDMHPDYETTRRANEMTGMKIAVQHHHAHMAACLADNGYQEPAIGVIMDGTGYGLDGLTWGGEFLIGDANGFQRAAHLQSLPLPGGDRAIYKPYRLALAYLHTLMPESPRPASVKGVPASEAAAIERMVDRGVNSPLTSSAGRLFDCISALLGICQEASYEAQAAIELEARASTVTLQSERPYAWGVEKQDQVQKWGHVEQWVNDTLVLGLTPLLEDVLADMGHTPVDHVARRFHVTMAHMIAETCSTLRKSTGLSVTALSGGCFQNRLLLSLVVPALRTRGFKALIHRQVPCNDGGLSLGQALIAHHTIER